MLQHNLENNNDVIISTQTGKYSTVGLITLNRPTALNALNLEMIHCITKALLEWQHDPSISAVVIRGCGEKAFCAGGDIKSLYFNGKQNPTQCLQFFYHEYRLNNLIKHYPKPYIALLHGITMGGGIGVSIHGTHRVAAHNLVLAMPESGIGFFTDVGASYFLSRSPDYSGFYLGLTGERINCADAKYIGLVDHIISDANHAEVFDTITSDLCNTQFSPDHNMNSKQVTEVLNKFCINNDSADSNNNIAHKIPTHIINNINDIKFAFNARQLQQVFNNLKELNSSWASATLATLNKKSPTSLLVILELLQRGAELSFEACMQMEYTVALGFLNSHDFYEGVRAAIIDKDNKPIWENINIQENQFCYNDYFNESVALKFVS